MAPVEKRFADCQVSFSGDAHDQEGLPAQEDVLHGVDKVWKDEGVEGIEFVSKKIIDYQKEEHDITGCQGYKTLMEG